MVFPICVSICPPADSGVSESVYWLHPRVRVADENLDLQFDVAKAIGSLQV